MTTRRRWLIGTAMALAMVGAGVGIVIAGTGADDGGTEQEAADDGGTVSADDRARAEAAALEAVGGGTATEVEVGDDGAAYGVEIRKDDGTQVEVHLDESFTVTDTATDDE